MAFGGVRKGRGFSAPTAAPKFSATARAPDPAPLPKAVKGFVNNVPQKGPSKLSDLLKDTVEPTLDPSSQFSTIAKKRKKREREWEKERNVPPAVAGGGVSVEKFNELAAIVDGLGGGGSFATLADVAQAQADAEAAAAAALAASEAAQAAIDAAQDAAAVAEEADDDAEEAATDTEQAVQDTAIAAAEAAIVNLQNAVIALQDALMLHIASTEPDDFQTTFDATDWAVGDPRTLTIPAGVHGLNHTPGHIFTVDVASPTGRNCEVDYETDILTGDVTLISRGDSFDGIVRIF